ncbi:transposase [Cohnella sp. GCM10027633]|uniref:transposase n=1 Tax=unclassified Cohnella TaxID=2636738 RepID=UPI00363A2321
MFAKSSDSSEQAFNSPKPDDFTSFEQFVAHYRDEDTCMRALFHAKWPRGFRCPRCSYSRYTPIHRRRLPLFECNACGHQASVTVGTVIEKSRTPLVLWFQAFYLHTLPEGISAVRLMEIIDTTYKTAWLICHKIREAMKEADANERLCGIVHINCAQYGRPYNPTVYRHPQEQPLLIGASADSNEEITYLKIQHVEELHLWSEGIISSSGKDAFIREHVAADAQVTANLLKYSPRRNRKLLAIAREASNWINSVFCGIGAKHLQAYLNQFSYLFNLSKHAKPAFHTLLNHCAVTKASTYASIVGKLLNTPHNLPLVDLFPKLIRLSKRHVV